MSNSGLRRARDLSPDLRQAVEMLLDRRQQEETISVEAYSTHEARTSREREEGWKRLMERIDKTASRSTNVPEAELDALIDEAAEYVRHHHAA